jgi:hypothetical protein
MRCALLYCLSEKHNRNGEAVSIVAWGDSVTDGGYLPSPDDRWQEQLLEALRGKYPRAQISLRTEGWGGRCEKTVFLSHLHLKMMILPRQARDKHGENSITRPFCCSSTSSYLAEPEGSERHFPTSVLGKTIHITL